MNEINELLEPSKIYEEKYKAEFAKEAESYFENLVKESGVDVAEVQHQNELLIDATNKYNNAKSTYSKSAKRKNASTVFGIILLAIGIIALIVGLYVTNLGVPGYVIAIVFGSGGLLLAGGIPLIVLASTKLKNRVQNNQNFMTRYGNLIKELKAVCYSKMNPLNHLFSWNMNLDVFKKVVPYFEIDKLLENKTIEYLMDNFDYHPEQDPNISTADVISGSIVGNPFMVQTYKVCGETSKVYTGSLTITYQVRVPNGGKSHGYHYETRTQVLHAAVKKPYPIFNYEKAIYYGSEAAPNLRFTRNTHGYNAMDKDERKKYTAKEGKLLNSLAENQSSKFTPFANKKFDILFHSWDRNNDVEYRLLFTPLAQKNFIDLIEGCNPCGDAFTFRKEKKLNLVKTAHSQYVDYVCFPDDFVHYSLDVCKKNFLDKILKFCESFYFDMAILLSIPLYQQYPSNEYKPNPRNDSRVPWLEAESLANIFSDLFKPIGCDTDIILTAEFKKATGAIDHYNIHSYGFKAVPRVDNIPMTGNDGIVHMVPVHWKEYIKVENDYDLYVIRKTLTRKEYIAKSCRPEYREFAEKYAQNGKIMYNQDCFAFVPLQGATLTDDSLGILLENEVVEEEN